MNVKEVSQLLKVSEHTIRYYSDEGLVPNLKRDKNNRRVYDDESVEWLRGVVFLRGLGLSLDSIREFEKLCFQEFGIEKRINILEEQLKKAEDDLFLAAQKAKLLKKKIEHEKNVMNHIEEEIHNPINKLKK